jgi:hypothetical protein
MLKIKTMPDSQCKAIILAGANIVAADGVVVIANNSNVFLC